MTTNIESFQQGLPTLAQKTPAKADKKMFWSQIDEVTSENLVFYKRLQPFFFAKLELNAVLIEKSAKQAYNGPARMIISPSEIGVKWEKIEDKGKVKWIKTQNRIAILITDISKPYVKNLSVCAKADLEKFNNLTNGNVVCTNIDDEIGFIMDIYENEAAFFENYSLV